MGYERNPRDRYRDNDGTDSGREAGSGGDYTYSSARDQGAGGYRDDNGGGRGAYRRDGGSFDQRPYGGYGGRSSQASHDGDRYRQAGEAGRGRQYGGQQSNRPPQGYDQDSRGFFDRAGDEVRSWFGDEDAERRREFDGRDEDGRGPGAGHHDRDYHEWRRGQISALDRDYDEYRRENQQKFHNEFGSWRTERQGQRSLLEKVSEHMEVVGSDGQHIGTVDKVRGDRIILTKSDPNAGGHHHSFPSRWIRSVDDKVMITKSAEEAQREWKDEERRTALFNDQNGEGENGPHNLNRSFSGTYRS